MNNEVLMDENVENQDEYLFNTLDEWKEWVKEQPVHFYQSWIEDDDILFNVNDGVAIYSSDLPLRVFKSRVLMEACSEWLHRWSTEADYE